MAVYKVSYVVTGDDHPGGIVNLDLKPEVGETIKVGNFDLEVVEIFELIPPRGKFFYLHATCKFVSE
jgi:hypothetical protein